jgi:glycosyltransferase involved in cell wall biosynthesis
MKVFDSLKDKNWSGSNFDLKKNSIYILKSAILSHSIKLKQGKFNLKVVGKKRTGFGKMFIEVLDEDNISIIKREISFNNNIWSEHSFDFNIPKDLGNGFIKISRDKNVYGSVELGRIILDLDIDVEKIIEQDLKLTKRNNLTIERTNNLELDNLFKFNEKKNIIFIVPYNIYGGAEVYIQNIINQVSVKHQIMILYLGENYLQNQILNVGVQHRVVKNIEQLKGIIKSLNFDYIVYYNRLDIYNMLVELKDSQEIGGKLIEIFHSEFRWPGSLSGLRERRHVNKFITVADNLAADITGIDVDSRETVRVGIDISKFAKKKDKTIRDSLELNNYNYIIGTVSRLSKEKNIDYFIDLAELMKDFGFVVVGSGPEEKRLRELIKSKKIKNINLVGFKKNVEDYYNIFDAFVLNSKMEGTPISILESMAAKVPVFVSMVGAIPTIVEHNKTGFSLSQKIEKDVNLIKNNIGNINVIDSAYQYVNEYHSIEKNAQDFMRVITSEKRFFIENKSNDNFILPGQYI